MCSAHKILLYIIENLIYFWKIYIHVLTPSLSMLLSLSNVSSSVQSSLAYFHEPTRGHSQFPRATLFYLFPSIFPSHPLAPLPLNFAYHGLVFFLLPIIFFSVFFFLQISARRCGCIWQGKGVSFFLLLVFCIFYLPSSFPLFFFLVHIPSESASLGHSQ